MKIIGVSIAICAMVMGEWALGEMWSEKENALWPMESPALKCYIEEEEPSQKDDTREEGCKPGNVVSQKSREERISRRKEHSACGMPLRGQIRWWLKNIHQICHVTLSS